MKNKFFLLLFIILVSTSLFSIPQIDEHSYKIKPGDIFLVQAISIDTLQVNLPVLPEGKISLYPIPKTLDVNGKTLFDVKKTIRSEIQSYFKKSEVIVELMRTSSFRYHVHGAVLQSGEFYSSTPITLHTVLVDYKQLLPKASKKIKILRNNEYIEYDFYKYLKDGDLSQNPVILDEDKIIVDYMEDYFTIYMNIDSANYIEYQEFVGEITIAEAINNIVNKQPYYENNVYSVLRDGEKTIVDENYLLMKNDKLFLSVEPQYVFVTGNVFQPGQIPYNGNRNLGFYISAAGGFSNIASKNSIYITHQNGEKEKYEGQEIEIGDTIYVKQKFIYTLGSYISPFSVIFTSIVTIYNLSK